MKKYLFFIVGLSMLFFGKPGFCSEENDNQVASQLKDNQGSMLTIVCSPDLKEMATNWAKHFEGFNSAISVRVSDFDQNLLTSENTIAVISDEFQGKTTEEQGMKMLVGRDILVPVINKNNPALAEICQQGITSEEFSILFSGSEKQNWANMINGGPDVRIRYYIVDNEYVKNGLADFIKINPAFDNAGFVENGTELLHSIENDMYSIGFCRLADVIDANTQQISEMINLLPVDKNKNGRIDSFENIYENLAEFTRGVWIGKYPSGLCGNIYVQTVGKPLGTEAVAFLSWLNTDGQKMLGEQGLCAVSGSEKERNLMALSGSETTVATEQETSNASIWIILLAVVFIVGFIVTAVVRSVMKAKGLGDSEEIAIKPSLDENSITAPKGLYFDRTHTWAFMEKDGMVKVGVDDFMQRITGTITRIKMKSPGEKIRRGEKLFTINRNGKQLDIYSPVTGIIKEQNHALETESAKINASPYADGWVYSIEPLNWIREIQLMFMAENYREWLRNEFARLRDFFAVLVKPNNTIPAFIVLQDGGELTDNVLADLGPDVWEEFQEKFINFSK